MTAFLEISILNKFVYLPRDSPLDVMMHFVLMHLNKPTMSDHDHKEFRSIPGRPILE